MPTTFRRDDKPFGFVSKRNTNRRYHVLNKAGGNYENAGLEKIRPHYRGGKRWASDVQRSEIVGL